MTNKQITIDVWRKYAEAITAIQYEVDSRDIQITLEGNGLPIVLSSAAVRLYAVKPDDEIIYNDCEVLDAVRGKVKYTLTEQTCIVPGTLKCVIEISGQNGILRTQEFTLTVLPSLDISEAVESTSEFTALETALSTVEQYDSRIGGLEDSVGEGWTAAGETWTRTSDYTFTIDGDKSNKYQPRDKFKLVQDGVVKYGWIVKVEYNGDVTTITTSPNTTLTTGAITNPFYSRAATPLGFELNEVLLWSGSVPTGDVITVPGILNYRMYFLYPQGLATYLTLYRSTNDSYLRGIGGAPTGDIGSQIIFSFNGTLNGEALTIDRLSSITHGAGSGHTEQNLRTFFELYGII